jgi:mannose-1-phosphate guanylyltransferase
MIKNYIKKPWGAYKLENEIKYKDVDSNFNNFLIKRLFINPNECISYQIHSNRDEVWFIEQGEGEFTLNNEIKIVQKGDILVIRKLQFHKIKCISDINLIIQEIQCGLNKEEDIKRVEDPYNR